MAADLSSTVALKGYKGDPACKMPIPASKESAFCALAGERGIHNRNFQNVSAYARRQIGIGIEGRFLKEGLPPVGNFGLFAVLMTEAAANTAALVRHGWRSLEALKIQCLAERIDLLVSGS